MIQISCHLGGLGTSNLNEALGTVARLGFRAVDLPLSLVDADRAVAQPTSEAEAIRTLLAEVNLSLTDFDVPLPDLSAPETEKREAALSRLEKLTAFAAALQVPGITLTLGDPPETEDDTWLEGVGKDLSWAKSMVGTAKRRLSILPAPETVAASYPDALKLLERASGVQLTLDVGYCAYLGMKRAEMAELLPKTAHVRARQATKNRLQVAFESGALDLSDLVEDLNVNHYEGAVSVAYVVAPGEHGSTKIDPIEETVKTRDALRNARVALQRA